MSMKVFTKRLDFFMMSDTNADVILLMFVILKQVIDIGLNYFCAITFRENTNIHSSVC